MIDGKFPDYEKVIPKDDREEIKADVIKFSNALDRLRALSSDRKGVVKIKIENNNITFNIKDITHGGGIEKIEANYTGKVLEIGFNSRYLLDIAKQISGAQVKFLLSDKLSPTLIFDDDDKQALYLLMPMHI